MFRLAIVLAMASMIGCTGKYRTASDEKKKVFTEEARKSDEFIKGIPSLDKNIFEKSIVFNRIFSMALSGNNLEK